jgi:hypothetical protein
MDFKINLQEKLAAEEMTDLCVIEHGLRLPSTAKKVDAEDTCTGEKKEG